MCSLTSNTTLDDIFRMICEEFVIKKNPFSQTQNTNII